MKEDEIIEFFNKSDKPKIKEYLDGIKSKMEIINSKNDRISLLLLLTFVAYFLIENSLITNVNLGIIEISKSDIGILAIPPIFSFLLLYYFVLTSHKSELLNTSNTLTRFYFKDEIKFSETKSEFSNLERQFLPFSFWTEIGKIFEGQNKKLGCLAGILILPIISLIVIPFWFQFYTIKVLIINYWDKEIFAKLSVYITCWLSISTLVYFIKTILNASKPINKNLNEGNT